MIQDQLVDYINSQIKLGVTNDAIKATLTGAGWQTVDVEDTFKKVEAAKIAQPISAMPITAKPAEPVVLSKPVVFSAATNPEPQTIKVSDLISSAAPVSSSPAKPVASKSPLTGPTMNATVAAVAKSANTFQAASYPASKSHGSGGAFITEIILAVVVIAVGAFAGFLYMQNNSLNSQLGTLNGQSSGVTSQLSTLQAEMAASTTALTAQVSSMNVESQELQSELSFYAVPSSSVTGATSTAVLHGIVSGGGKVPYVIIATYGAKVYIANSKVAGVIAALAPLLGTAAVPIASTTPASPVTTSTATTTAGTAPAPAPAIATPATAPSIAQFSGTYVLGSDTITLTAVNGTSIQ